MSATSKAAKDLRDLLHRLQPLLAAVKQGRRNKYVREAGGGASQPPITICDITPHTDTHINTYINIVQVIRITQHYPLTYMYERSHLPLTAI
jgi:hypothetical protein